MRHHSLSAALVLPLLSLLALGCDRGFDNGFAVALTIRAAADLPDTTLSSIRVLALEVSGAETSSERLTVGAGFAGSREERVLYRPIVTSGALQLQVIARDAMGEAVAYGETTATLAAGATVSATVLLGTMIPPQPDLGPSDMGPPPGTPVITPASVSVPRLGTQTFSADLAVDWSVMEAGGGSIDGTGTYTAPAHIGSYHVVATNQLNPGLSATATVNVTFAEVQVIAGATGGSGSADGSGSAARFAPLHSGITVDNAGELFIADRYNHVIRKVTSAGVVTTIAGKAGAAGSDNGVGALARFREPYGVAVDALGTVLYVSELGNHTLRRIDLTTATVTTLAGLAGTPGTIDDATLGANVRFNGPAGLALDAAGGWLYVAEYNAHVIRRVNVSSGATTLLIGTANTPGASNLAPVSFRNPIALAFDGSNLYVADSQNHVIRKIVLAGPTIITLAGAATVPGSTDDVAIGSNVRFNLPAGVAFAGNALYVSDGGNHTLRLVDASNGATFTIAGSATQAGAVDAAAGGVARFFSPEGITVAAGFLYVNDARNTSLRRVVQGGGFTVTTLAGIPSQRDSVDGLGDVARFDRTYGVTSDGAGNAYVADTNNHTIRKLAISNSGGTYTADVTTFAGTPKTSGNLDGVGAAARFAGPSCVVYDGANALYVCDFFNSAIRRVALADAGATTIFSVPSPRDLALDGQGHLYVASGNHVVYEYTSATQQLRPLWGLANQPGSTDGVGPSARFNLPAGLAHDGQGHLFVTDQGNHSLRRIDLQTGQVTTAAGKAGESGSTDGAGVDARFNAPTKLLFHQGTIYLGDTANHTVRRYVPATDSVTTLLGVAGAGGMMSGPLPAGLNRTNGVALLSTGEMVIISDDGEQAVQLAR